MTELTPHQLVRRAIRRQPWQPGLYGKGLVTATGTTYIWQEKTWYDGGKRLYIDHYDAVEAGLADYSAIHFYIDRNASFYLGRWATAKQKAGVLREVNKLINGSFS